MKKNLGILLIALTILTGAAFAGDSPDSFTSMALEANTKAFPKALAAPVFVDTMPTKAASVTFFNDQAIFTAAAPGLTLEDFENGAAGPGAVVGCPVSLSNATPGACFPAGELEDGFTFDATTGVTVALGSGVVPVNPTTWVAADLFASGNVLNFTDPGVFAVGFELFSFFNAPITLSVFGDGGVLLGTATHPAGATFFGVMADETIAQISIAPGAVAVFDNLQFGTPGCTAVTYDFESGVIDPAWTLAGIGNANQESVEIVDDGGNLELALTADGPTAYYGTDNAGFFYQELSGDFRVETTLDSTTMTTGKAWRKAGLMARASLDHLDIRLLAMLAPVQNRLQFVAREVYGGPGNVKVANAVTGAPAVVRLAIERVGQELTVQYSSDGGVTWITPATGLGGSIEIAALPATLHVGLAMVSNDISVTSTGLFDDVSICQAPE